MIVNRKKMTGQGQRPERKSLMRRYPFSSDGADDIHKARESSTISQDCELCHKQEEPGASDAAGPEPSIRLQSHSGRVGSGWEIQMVRGATLSNPLWVVRMLAQCAGEYVDVPSPRS